MTDSSEVDVVILCGGLGKRLRPVVFSQPKVLAKIGERTFLDILIDNLLLYGFKNIILSIGYLKEQIKKHYDKKYDYKITFSEEEEPLGTGGALKKAKTLIRSNPFMVMNGDSICNVNFRSFIDFHVEKKALLSIVLVRSKTAEDYGSVTLDDSHRITDFNEKVAGGSRNENIINAGVYLMETDIFSYMPEQNTFSLEYDLFSKIINNRCYGFLTESEFIDIGTPERYENAKDMYGKGKKPRDFTR
jgi:NDP-sugar pyrophosphorylase family protein